MFSRFEPANGEFTAPGPSLPTPTPRIRGFLAGYMTKFVNSWFALQLPHYGGKYSAERMLALEQYTRSTSFERVLLVTISVPLLVLVLVLCQEVIPLQDPAAGWKANYGFWCRAGLVGVGVGNAASIQMGFWLDVPPFSLKQILVCCLLMGSSYAATGMIAAKLWVFPIPFFMFTLCLVNTAAVVVYIRLVMGARMFQLMLSRRDQLRRLNKVGAVQALMFVIYPAYQVLFTETKHSDFELPVLMLLPMIRLVLKLMFATAAAHKEDMVPAQVVFTVDFFDSFYFATVVQSVSYLSLAGIMGIGLLQTASEVHELHQRTRRILSRLNQLPGMVPTHGNNLLGAVRELCNSVDKLGYRINRSVQLRSCVYHELSDEARALLSKLERHSCANSCINSYQHNLKTLSRAAFVVPKSEDARRNDLINCCFRGKVAAKPPPEMPTTSPKMLDIPNRAPTTDTTRKRSVVQTSAILQEALEVLFTSECLVLSEYMKVIVPAGYGIFVLALVQLPNAKYHTELAGITTDNVADIVLRILAYALMEFGPFIVLAVLKKRSCGISVLHQLAFVLETQTLFVQSTLMMWISMTLTYRVVHFVTRKDGDADPFLRGRWGGKVFFVDIKANLSVGHLRTEIKKVLKKKKKKGLGDMVRLKLYLAKKGNTWLSLTCDDMVAVRSGTNPASVESLMENAIGVTREIVEVFGNASSNGVIHVLVKVEQAAVVPVHIGPNTIPIGREVNTMSCENLLKFTEGAMKNKDAVISNPRLLIEESLQFSLVGRETAILTTAKCFTEIISSTVSDRNEQSIPVCSGISGLGKMRMLEVGGMIVQDVMGLDPKHSASAIVPYSNEDGPQPVEKSMPLRHRSRGGCCIDSSWTSRLPRNGDTLWFANAIEVIERKLRMVRGLPTEKDSPMLYLFLGIDDYQKIEKVGSQRKDPNTPLLHELVDTIGEFLCTQASSHSSKLVVLPMFPGTDLAVIASSFISNPSYYFTVRLPMNLLTMDEVLRMVEKDERYVFLLKDSEICRKLLTLGGVPRWVAMYLEEVKKVCDEKACEGKKTADLKDIQACFSYV